MFKIALTHPQDEADIEREFIPEGATLEIVHCPTEEDLIEKLKDFDAVISAYEPFTRNVISQLPNLKIISQAAIGFNTVDIQAAKEFGIPVINNPTYCIPEVADHTMGLILNLNRRIMEFDKSVQVDKEWRYDLYTDISRLGTQTIGLFGFGAIAREVAKRAKAFGARIITSDPFMAKDFVESHGAELVSVEELFNQADIISIHSPLTEDTRGFFSIDKFEKMKKKPYIVNAGRGEIIKEKDLVEALDKGLIRGAGLDVLADESPDLNKSELVGRWNVILTPHVAYYSIQSQYEIQKMSAKNISLYLDKKYDELSIVNGVKK